MRCRLARAFFGRGVLRWHGGFWPWSRAEKEIPREGSEWVAEVVFPPSVTDEVKRAAAASERRNCFRQKKNRHVVRARAACRNGVHLELHRHSSCRDRSRDAVEHEFSVRRKVVPVERELSASGRRHASHSRAGTYGPAALSLCPPAHVKQRPVRPGIQRFQSRQELSRKA